MYIFKVFVPNVINQDFDRSSRRKRGMTSNPPFIIPDFFCIFQTNFAMATLGFKEMGKFLWEGRENGRERKGLRGKNNKKY